MTRTHLLTGVLTLLLMNPYLASGAGPCCQHCGAHCESHRLVPKTVMVPIVVTETRIKPCVVEKTEEREETYTVFKRVPVKRKYEKEVCYLEDEVKTKKITKTECHRVTNPVFRTSVVNVPQTEMQTTMVREEVCTECGKICVERPCTCQVTRLHKELRSSECQEQDIAFEKMTKDISYCVKTPKIRKELCAEETVYELVPVEKTRKICVCVPEILKKPVDVQVTKMVPKTIYCCEKCCKLH
jgi:hypothetical protein